MTTDGNTSMTAFSWNAGGWFGSQLGCTLWLLILGFVVLSKDSIAAVVCLVGFVALNAWGLSLWRRREHLNAYAGLQRYLLAASLIIALVVVVLNGRGVSEPPIPGALVSTYLPYWSIAVAPALMLLFFLRERQVKRSQG